MGDFLVFLVSFIHSRLLQVVRSALVDASRAASLMTTAEAVIVDAPKDEGMIITSIDMI